MPPQDVPLPFPAKGLEENFAYSEQSQLTTADCLNVRGYDGSKGRLRGGRRAGTSKFRETKFASGTGTDAVVIDIITVRGTRSTFTAAADDVLVAGFNNEVNTVDFLGNESYSYQYGGSGESVRNIVRLANGDIIMAGDVTTDADGTGGDSATVVRTNADGTVTKWWWNGNDLSNVADKPLAYDPLTDRVYVITNSSTFDGHSSSHAQVVALRADGNRDMDNGPYGAYDGNPIWEYNNNTATNMDARQIAVDSVGRVYYTVERSNVATTAAKEAVVCLLPDGSKNWGWIMSDATTGSVDPCIDIAVIDETEEIVVALQTVADWYTKPIADGGVVNPTAASANIWGLSDEGVVLWYANYTAEASTNGDKIRHIRWAFDSSGAYDGNLYAVFYSLTQSDIYDEDFSVDTGWTKGSGWAIGSGVATWTQGSGDGNLEPNPAMSVESGVMYNINFDITAQSGDAAIVAEVGGVEAFFDTDDATAAVDDDYTVRITTTGTGNLKFKATGSSGAISLDNVVVRKEYPHLVKLNGANRTSNSLTKSWQYQVQRAGGQALNDIALASTGELYLACDDSDTYDEQDSSPTYKSASDPGNNPDAQIIALNADGTIYTTFSEGSSHPGTYDSATGSPDSQAITLTPAASAAPYERITYTLVVTPAVIAYLDPDDVVGTPGGDTTLSGFSTSNGEYIPMLQDAYGKVYIVDGQGPKVYDPDSDEVQGWTATSGKGTVPQNARLIALYRGRIVLSGIDSEPYNWFMSKLGDPNDWDYSPATTNVTQAVAGNLSNLGQIGDIINTIMPFNDDVCLFGCDGSIWAMSGDPADGGVIDLVTDQTGTAFGSAWTKSPSGIIYFAGVDGIYALERGSLPVNITAQRIKRRIDAVDLTTYSFHLAWDHIQDGLYVLIRNKDLTGVNLVLFWERRNDAWWIDEYPANIGPATIFSYNADDPDDNATLFGGFDGYVYKIDPSTTEGDDGFNISSRVRLGPMVYGGIHDTQKLICVQSVLGNNSGDVTMKVFAEDTAEALLTGTAKYTRTLKAGNNPDSIRRVRGYAHDIELSADSKDPWSLEGLRGRFVYTGDID